jgi:hypothetical protein
MYENVEGRGKSPYLALWVHRASGSNDAVDAADDADQLGGQLGDTVCQCMCCMTPWLGLDELPRQKLRPIQDCSVIKCVKQLQRTCPMYFAL